MDNDVLHGNAANLAAFLMKMADSHPDHYAQIEETIRQVAPFFGQFVLKEVSPGQTQLLWKDRYSDLSLLSAPTVGRHPTLHLPGHVAAPTEICGDTHHR